MNPEDAALFKQAIDESLDHLRPWMSWARREPQDIEQKIARLRHLRSLFDTGRDFVYGIFNPEETKLVGASGLYTEVGQGAREIAYWIHKDFINQGMATETAASLVRVAFEIDHVERVEIHCDPKNMRSAAIPQKLGFFHEATLRARAPSVEGPLRDAMIWSMFADQYRSSPARDAVIRAFDAMGRPIV